jgi:hypothetical protein
MLSLVFHRVLEAAGTAEHIRSIDRSNLVAASIVSTWMGARYMLKNGGRIVT